METVTKSWLARELGVSPSRVSQLVRSGLPVRQDGRLDREAALRWVTRYCVGSTCEAAKRLLSAEYTWPPEPPWPQGTKIEANEAWRVGLAKAIDEHNDWMGFVPRAAAALAPTFGADEPVLRAALREQVEGYLDYLADRGPGEAVQMLIEGTA